ncbi:MAG: exo-alpha-sialidase [Pirellulaceae bacterium]
MFRLTQIVLLGLIVSVAVAVRAEPILEQTEVFVAGRDDVFQYRIPALVTTTKGTLIAACDARKDRSGDPPNNIDHVCKRSLDGGRTWGPLQVVADFPGTEAAGDPCLLVDQQTGTVWVFYAWCPEGVGTAASQPGLAGRTIRVYAMTSDDDGVTWSPPRDLNPMVKDPEWSAMWCSPGRGLQTRKGRLLVPSTSLRGGVSHSQLFASDDHGKTWKTLTASGHKTNEHMVVELSKGPLLANMRSRHGKGCRALATSRDGGQTWSELAHDPKLPEPVCQASFIRYTARQDGSTKDRLLFCNPASRRRENMTVRVSYDEGKTWPVSKVVHAGPAAYSCLTVLADRTIGLLYERGENNPYETITFARFNLEWLTDGEDPL